MKRLSNIELLRCTAFLMVIFIHVSTSGLFIDNGIKLYSVSWYYSTFIRNLVNPAITLFILISGYVTYKNKEKFSIRKQIKKIYIPIAIYMPFFIYVHVQLLGLNINSFIEIFKIFISLDGIVHHLWYVVSYTFILFLIPLMISGIDNLNKNKIRSIIIYGLSVIGISELINIVFSIGSFKCMFSNYVLYMLMLFITGSYIAKYDVKIKKKNLLLIILIALLSNYIIFYILNSKTGSEINFATIDNNFNILNIIQSICIFLFFKNLTINSSVINNVSKYTYGGYVIHTFYIFSLQKFFPFLNYVRYNSYFIFDILFVLSVAICSLCTEYIRVKVFLLIDKKLKSRRIYGKKENFDFI